MNFELVGELKTSLYADTVEWCPFEPYQHYFLCGTYALQNADQELLKSDAHQVRLGEFHLFSVLPDLKLHLHNTSNTGGILDCKWCPQVIHHAILVVSANAAGSVMLWSFENDDHLKSFVKYISSFNLNEGNVLSLSVDWHVAGSEVKICVSDSAGYITVLKIGDNFEFILLTKLKIHDYEAWIVTFNPSISSQILSGADDCLLKITDLQSDKEIAQLKEHASGVTSVRFNHLKEHTFATGSYDETIKLWDMRNISKSLSTYHVGGGIWRMKWDPEDAMHILVAGMYSGFFWLNYNSSNETIVNGCSFKGHSSIAYGADICYLNSRDLNKKYPSLRANESLSIKLTITCSFYDKKLCLCTLK